jgi:PAS domain S-box-containing protein
MEARFWLDERMRLSHPLLRLGLTLLTLATLVVGGLFTSPPPHFPPLVFVLAVALVALCANFPVVLPEREFNLAHVAGMTTLFVFGPVPAAWAVVLGLIVGEGVRTVRPSTGAGPRDYGRVFVEKLSWAIVRQALPLLIASAVYIWIGGRFPVVNLEGQTALALIGFSLAYVLARLALLVLERGPRRTLALFRAHGLQLGALEFLPLLIAMIAAEGYRRMGISLIAALGSVLGISAYSLHSFSRAQAQLEHQIVENARLHAETERRAAELTRLLEVSSTLSATLGRQDVLKMICASAREMTKAAGAALYLLDTERAELTLAHAEGLSAGFAASAAAVSVTHDDAGAALASREPRLVTEDRLPQDAPAGWANLLEAERLPVFLGLPLIAQGEPVGSLVVFFREPPEFQPWTMAVMRAFGNQAALTIANTHLYTHTAQVLARRVRQLGALESISRELSATLDLQHLFDLIVARAKEETNALTGQLGLLDASGQQFTFAAWQGFAPEVVEANREKAWPVERGGVAGRVLRTGQAARLGDVRGDPDYIVINPDLRSELCVPILREGRVLGVIVLESDRLDAFTEDDQAFVNQLAVQAAIAIDNARLYNEARLRLQEQSILYEASAVLAASLEVRKTYTAVAQQLAQAVHADACVLSDYDAQAGLVRKVEPRNLSMVYVAASFPATARVLSDRTPLVVRLDDPGAPEAEVEALKAEGYSAALKLPMISGDQTVGLVELYSRRPREFGASEVRLAQTMAHQAATAIQNAWLFRHASEGRERLAAVLNSTHEGVLVLEASGIVSLANPRLEEFWGISATQLVGKHMLTLLDDPALDIAARLGFQREEIQELLMTLRAGLALSIPKIQFQIGTPRPRFLERSGAPVLDPLAKAIGWVIILRDVTEEKEIEEVRNALSGMIVHDLRSPLTTTLVSLAMIREQIPPEAKTSVTDQALQVSTRSLNKVLGLVNTLLDVSRMESGELTLNRAPVDMGQLAEEIISDLTPLANEYGVFLINEIAPGLPPVWADREKVGRVLTNLIDNALKFTPEGGQVRVRSELAADGGLADGTPGLLCAVLDGGPGIPEDYREKVFDRFAQIRGRQGRRAGSGLGLAFCKMAVEAHGGRIWIENRPEGGSKFSFTLPVSSDQ